ncbi:MAG: alpha/beta hydrolase [Acidimicrobiales bacterium]|nr:alpha/beta hydrolase [Acidimicrobiales bacterium]
MLVFVHGVPETAAVWDRLRPLLQTDSVALQLPGFGVARPDGFGATKDEYVDWIVGRLDEIGAPVDLVGHDWGAAFTYRVATAHGDRLRSWAADVANVMHAEYQWHDFARVWQTPGEGEQFFEQQLATPVEEQAEGFVPLGLARDDAVALLAEVDATMAGSILDLYRSALPNPRANWTDGWRPTSARGLVIHATDDPFGDLGLSRAVADSLGAGHESLQGCGHWWML